jgi:hypothetical protein
MRRELWYTVSQWRQERTLANEAGHVLPPPELCYDSEPISQHTPVEMQDGVEVIIPVDPRAAECLDTRAFNQSVSTEEDSRLNPST